MKAVQFSSAGVSSLRLIELRDPQAPRAGEITVKLAASSLNFHDYAVVAGYVAVKGPRVPLSDGAGTVIAIGEDVTEFDIGDTVVSTFFTRWLDGERVTDDFADVPGDGIDGYAREFVTMPASAFTHVPRGFSLSEAATLPCAGLTAWRALLVDGSLAADETVLVLGTGGVSIFALQFAKAMGATVIATTSSEEKAERLKAIGADHVINYRQHPNWGTKARAVADGGGVNHVVEVGGPGTLRQSIEALRNGGHIAIVGMRAGQEGQFPTMDILRKQARLSGLTVGSRQQQLDMVRTIESTGIRPIIDDKRFPLADLAEAFRYQQTSAHFGKIVIDI